MATFNDYLFTNRVTDLHSPRMVMMIPVLVTAVFLSLIVAKMIRKWNLVGRIAAIPTTVNPIRGTTVRAVAWSWMAPTGVMAVFVALSGAARSDLDRLFKDGSSSVVPSSVDPSKLPILADMRILEGDRVADPSAEPDKLPILSDGLAQISESNTGVNLPASATRMATPRRAQSSESKIGVNLPKWIQDGDNTFGDVRRTVLSSGIWSTEAEARQELLPRAASIVRADFDERHHGPLDRAGLRFLSDERVIEAAVKEKYVELAEQDFGMMYRLWWQIEVSPVVRTELYPAWKAAVVGNRVIVIGTVLALLTLAANATALFAKLKSVPNRRSIYTAAVVATSAVAWIAGDLLVVNHLCQ